MRLGVLKLWSQVNARILANVLASGRRLVVTRCPRLDRYAVQPGREVLLDIEVPIAANPLDPLCACARQHGSRNLEDVISGCVCDLADQLHDHAFLVIVHELDFGFFGSELHIQNIAVRNRYAVVDVDEVAADDVPD
ncbi:TPA: hypothetical protein RJR42_000099 [Burkholderia cepacia]|nr:hypothetical protein [Burkholderia vietnamiensis]HDV6364341.1 hypothetical protein [Burkholderia cepacia]